MSKKNFKAKLKRLWDSFCLRLSLLRIWFFKNLKTFLMIALIIYAIAILTGNATGGAIFGNLSKLIEETTSSTTTGDTIMNILMVLLSGGTSATNFIKKVKNITLSDIKSKKLKYAMVSAGLYFNANGKLTKRVEHSLKMDIDGDGRINNTAAEDVKTETNDLSVVKGTITALEELGTILTTKIETEEDFEKIMSDDMKKMNDVIKETSAGASEIQERMVDQFIEETAKETAVAHAKGNKDKEFFLIAFFKFIGNNIKKLFKKIFRSGKSADELAKTVIESSTLPDENLLDEVLTTEDISFNTNNEIEIIVNENTSELLPETVEGNSIISEQSANKKSETTTADKPTIKKQQLSAAQKKNQEMIARFSAKYKKQ